MIQVLSAKKCKEIDKRTIEEICIPSIILMENAAVSLTKEVLKLEGKSFLIFCGKGNNGGDGLALARHLIAAGKTVKIYIVSKDENYSDDFRINLDIIKNITNEIKYIKLEDDIDEFVIRDLKQYDNVVDGILGIGLNKELSGIYKNVISRINEYANNIVSIDVPSGLDCDAGIPRDIAIKASMTYTFEVIKKGFLLNTSSDYLGELKVLKIGIPSNIKESCSEKVYVLENKEYQNLIPVRTEYGYKGNYGRALIAAGSVGYTGAAYITTECTVRSGAGLTTLICSKDVQKILSSKLIEAMSINLEDEKLKDIIKNADSIAFGPGIGTGKKEEELLKFIIENSECPIVIDADGITILSTNKDLFKLLKGRCVITPHPGEMSRLTGFSIKEIEANRFEISKQIAIQYGIIVLLKGHNTIITDGNRIYANPTGNSKMASGGMGDALTGIINGFIAQGMSILESSLLSAYVHGYIADELGKESYVINARDVINELPKKINKLMSNK